MEKTKHSYIHNSRGAEAEHLVVSGSPGSGRNICVFTPEQFTEEVERALPLSIPAERKRLLEHARAWAISSYHGDVPESLNRQLATLEERYGNAR